MNCVYSKVFLKVCFYLRPYPHEPSLNVADKVVGQIRGVIQTKSNEKLYIFEKSQWATLTTLFEEPLCHLQIARLLRMRQHSTSLSLNTHKRQNLVVACFEMPFSLLFFCQFLTRAFFFVFFLTFFISKAALRFIDITRLPSGDLPTFI